MIFVTGTSAEFQRSDSIRRNFQVNGSLLFTALFDQLGDEPGPAGLMACADPGSIVTVEVLVEKNKVTPVGIALKNLGCAGDRATALLIAQKDADEPPGDFRGHQIGRASCRERV